MKIPLYFRFIFRKLFFLFLAIHFSLLFGFFCLDSFAIHSLPGYKKMILHFFSLTFLKSDLFLPLSFLLAAIHTIQSLKQHNEFIALQVSGISKFRLSLPYFTLSLFLALFSYGNVEFGIPQAHIWEGSSKIKSLPFEVHHLADQSRVLYQRDLSDLYWVRSNKEIWHCKKVSMESGILVGHFVDHLKRNSSGQFEKGDSFLELPLPFILDTPQLFSSSAKTSPFSKIFQTLIDQPLSSDRAQFLTAFLYKLVHPWFPFLFMTAILAFLLPSRTVSPYFPFLIGIFLTLLFYAMMKTFIILGAHYFLSPWVTLFFIPLGMQGIFTYKLCKN